MPLPGTRAVFVALKQTARELASRYADQRFVVDRLKAAGASGLVMGSLTYMSAAANKISNGNLNGPAMLDAFSENASRILGATILGPVLMEAAIIAGAAAVVTMVHAMHHRP